jgi:REP element-mobilizing transposase RayT
MAETIGYMLTWTTYGTWLQGELKGFVKNGEVLGDNVALRKSNIRNLKGGVVKLRRKEKAIVREALMEAAKGFKQKIRAIAVHSNHVHVVCEYVDVPLSALVGHYKNAGRKALKKTGFEGRVWTRGYDKRYCFDEKALQDRINYVQRHGR